MEYLLKSLSHGRRKDFSRGGAVGYFPQIFFKRGPKEKAFGLRLANISAFAIRGLYCSSSKNLVKKALHEITVNIQGYLYPFSIVGCLATSHHKITWHLGIGDERFVRVAIAWWLSDLIHGHEFNHRSAP